MMIDNSHDQAVSVSLTVFTGLTDEVERTFYDAMQKGSARSVFDYGRALLRFNRLSSLSLAKYLVTVEDNWPLLQATGIDEGFEEVMVSELGLAHQTIRKYTNLWRRLYENPAIPAEIKTEMAGQPIKSQLLVSALAAENDVTMDQWRELVAANDSAEMSEIVRGIRGEQTSSGSRLIIIMDPDGSLRCRKGDESDYTFIGFLTKDAGDTGRQAIDRILHNSGIMEI